MAVMKGHRCPSLYPAGSRIRPEPGQKKKAAPLERHQKKGVPAMSKPYNLKPDAIEEPSLEEWQEISVENAHVSPVICLLSEKEGEENLGYLAVEDLDHALRFFTRPIVLDHPRWVQLQGDSVSRRLQFTRGHGMTVLLRWQPHSVRLDDPTRLELRNAYVVETLLSEVNGRPLASRIHIGPQGGVSYQGGALRFMQNLTEGNAWTSEQFERWMNSRGLKKIHKN